MGRKGGVWGLLKSLGRRSSAVEDPLDGFVKIELRPDSLEIEPSARTETEATQTRPSAGGAPGSPEPALTEAITHCVNTYHPTGAGRS